MGIQTPTKKSAPCSRRGIKPQVFLWSQAENRSQHSLLPPASCPLPFLINCYDPLLIVLNYQNIWVANFQPNSNSRAIIDIEIKIAYMSFSSCACCVVVLNQQQERNISHQNQCQDAPINHSKNMVKTCTVVENGRVVVKPIQNQPSE